MGLIGEILDFPSIRVSEFNINSLKRICNYLEIKTIFIFSNSWANGYIEEESDKPEQKLIKKLNNLQGLKCKIYINTIGGTELYDKKSFAQNGYKLSFIRMQNITYPQYSSVFLPNLSIIDILMFNTKEQIKKMLDQYELI